MNERIEELAEQQAGSILMDLIMPDAGMPERVKWNVGCTTEHLEKFAELIVRECMRMCDVAAIGYESHNHFKEANGCYSAKEYIEEHFGVEE